MFFSRILVAFDGSDLARKALDKAMEIGKIDSRIRIDVIYVIKMHTAPCAGLDGFEALEEAIYQQGEEMIAEVQQMLSEIPNYSKTYLLKGLSPAYIILNHAKEYNSDLIIMGNRGLSGLKEFLGSVSHTVVQEAPIPVLIIK